MTEETRVQYSFYLDKALLQRLQDAAWRKRLPLSELLRQLGEEFLQKEGE
jgi:hypothetical protein